MLVCILAPISAYLWTRPLVDLIINVRRICLVAMSAMPIPPILLKGGFSRFMDQETGFISGTTNLQKSSKYYFLISAGCPYSTSHYSMSDPCMRPLLYITLYHNAKYETRTKTEKAKSVDRKSDYRYRYRYRVNPFWSEQSVCLTRWIYNGVTAN